jgi:hypothetical protein
MSGNRQHMHVPAAAYDLNSGQEYDGVQVRNPFRA